MKALTFLWLVSIALAVSAIAVMIGLILARLRSERRARSSEAERRRQIPLLLGVAPAQGPGGRGGLPGDLLTDLTIEFIRLVRGDEREAFLASAARLGVPERLRLRLRRGRPSTRLAAAEALGHFADDESVEALHASLDDSHAEVRLSAALSLAGLGRAPPARALVDRLGLGTQEHSLLTISLFREIAKGKPDEVASLLADDAIAPSVKAAAIEALAGTRDQALVPIVSDLAEAASSDGDELPRFLRALGEFGHPAGAPAVLRHLGSSVAIVRAAAAEAAGRIGLIESANRLEALLGDEDWSVRFQAGRALAQLGRVGAERLERSARSGGGRVGETAAQTLAELASSG